VRLRADEPAFCIFLMGPMNIVHELPKIEKRSHGFCYSVLFLKNYFVAVFSTINF